MVITRLLKLLHSLGYKLTDELFAEENCTDKGNIAVPLTGWETLLISETSCADSLLYARLYPWVSNGSFS
jgi:hypothetical protein